MQSTPAAAPVGDLWVDRFPSHIVGIKGITLIDDPTNLYEIETYTPHYRKPGDPVSPSRVKVPGVPNPVLSSVYNGLFQVYAVTSPTKFQYKLLTAPEAKPSNVYVSDALIGWEYHGILTDGGTGAVEEGNRVYGARFGHYNDTGSSKDLTIRNNYYHDVVCGVYYSMGLVGPLTPIATNQRVTRDPATLIATFTTPVAHGLLPKSAVQIIGAIVDGTANNPYNGRNPDGTFINATKGIFEVLDVPTSTSFKYQLDANPGSDAVTDTGQYAEYWRVRRLVVENNVVELTPPFPEPLRQSLLLWLTTTISPL